MVVRYGNITLYYISLEHKLTGDQWYLQQICHNSGLSFDSHSNTLENAIAIFGRVQLLSDSGSNFEV